MSVAKMQYNAEKACFIRLNIRNSHPKKAASCQLPVASCHMGLVIIIVGVYLSLLYMQARYYDPLIGRFYADDPIGFTGSVDTFNRYSYVGNNPYKFTDPSGMTKQDSYTQCQIDPNCYNAIPRGGGASQKAGNGERSSNGAAAGAVVGGVIGTAGAIACDGLTYGICAAGNPAIITGSIALGAVTGDQLERAIKALPGLIAKIRGGRMEFQYAIVADFAGYYPDLRNGGQRWLNVGDVYKYGTSADPDNRYPDSYFRGGALSMRIEYVGPHYATLAMEKHKLIVYAITHADLPAGNRIFK